MLNKDEAIEIRDHALKAIEEPNRFGLTSQGMARPVIPLLNKTAPQQCNA